MMTELEEGVLQQLSDEVLLTIVKCAYDAHDVVLAEAEHRALPAATELVALVEVMSALGLVSHRWRRVACDPAQWRQRHNIVFGGAPFPHLQPPFPHIAWRQAYLAKAKRWWSVRNSPIPVLQGVCHPTILFAVVEGAPALLDRLLLHEKAEEALARLSAQKLVQANSLEVALAREARGEKRDIAPWDPQVWDLKQALNAASCWGNVGLVKVVLELRQDQGLSGRIPLTAIQLAAREGREQVVRYFVDKKLARPFEPAIDDRQQSVVLAASRGHTKTVEALLESYPHGKRPGAVSSAGDAERLRMRETLRVALICAASGGHVETVRVLVEKVDYNWQLVNTIDLGVIDALLPDLADNPTKVEARKKWRKKLSGRVLSSRWMRTAAETLPALAIELGWLLMAKGLDIDSGRPLSALQIAAQGDSPASVPLVQCLLSLGADPKACGSLGTVSPKTLAVGNATIIDALSAAAASRRGGGGGGGVTLTAMKFPPFKADEYEEVVRNAGKKRKSPSPADDDAMDKDPLDEAGGGDRGSTSAKRRRTEGNEVSRMAELLREWVAERWSKVTAQDWIPHHFTTFYLRAQLHQCGLQPQGSDERVELMRQLAEHIAEARGERQVTLQEEELDVIVHPRVEVPGGFQLFITPPA